MMVLFACLGHEEAFHNQLKGPCSMLRQSPLQLSKLQSLVTTLRCCQILLKKVNKLNFALLNCLWSLTCVCLSTQLLSVLCYKGVLFEPKIQRPEARSH